MGTSWPLTGSHPSVVRSVASRAKVPSKVASCLEVAHGYLPRLLASEPQALSFPSAPLKVLTPSQGMGREDNKKGNGQFLSDCLNPAAQQVAGADPPPTGQPENPGNTNHNKAETDQVEVLFSC